jgi:hypothetical protein
VRAIPHEGGPTPGDGPDRVLRGSCLHNQAIHSLVSKRYPMERQEHDGCAGFRVVLAETGGRSSPAQEAFASYATCFGCNEPGPFSEGYLDKGTQGSLLMAFPARQ